MTTTTDLLPADLATASTTDLFRLLPEEMEELVVRLGQPRYRAGQILHALYREGAVSLSDITVLPRAFREQLAADGCVVGSAEEVRRVVSDDGQTTKLLLSMAGGTLIETVLMQYPVPGDRHPRSTVCVSSQAGCAMGCVFCATGQMGFLRNLRAEEMVAQVIHVARLLQAKGQHITNIVFMGMGEPLANYGEAVRAIRLLTHARAFNLAQRSITVSTVGLIHAIDRLAGEGLQVGLAISLHSPDDGLRQRLVPTAGPDSVNNLMSAAKRYFRKTGRRVTFEYALIDGLNDTPELARQLVARVRGSGCHVNLIPVNPTAGGHRRPSRARVLEFERILRDGGVNCTVRVEKGSEISAACGQLRLDEALSSSPGGPVHGRRQSQPSPAPSQSQ